MCRFCPLFGKKHEEYLMEQMCDFETDVDFYSLPTVEGKLSMDYTSERFIFDRRHGKRSTSFYLRQLHRNSILKMNGKTGSVEHTVKDGYEGYYFKNRYLSNPLLEVGMRCRVRQK